MDLAVRVPLSYYRALLFESKRRGLSMGAILRGRLGMCGAGGLGGVGGGGGGKAEVLTALGVLVAADSWRPLGGK